MSQELLYRMERAASSSQAIGANFPEAPALPTAIPKVQGRRPTRPARYHWYEIGVTG